MADFEAPQSGNEAILQNILGAGNMKKRSQINGTWTAWSDL